MTPVLLFPAGLAALTAVVVPLAIHLARDPEMRRTDFAALRWLTPRARPRRRRRFDEWPLLIARLVLIALVAAWLARPAVFGAADTTPYVAVMPGVDPAHLPAGSGARRHWLAPGFPALDTPAPAGRLPVASLVRDLDATLPPATPLRIVVPATLDGADAERPRLSRAVTWQVVASALPATSAQAVAVSAPPALDIRVAPARAAAARYFRAAAVAWAKPGTAPAFAEDAVARPLPPLPVKLIWLVPGPLPAAVDGWVKAGGTALVDGGGTAGAAATTAVVWRDAVGVPLATMARLGRGRVVRLTRPLDAAAFPELLDRTFPAHLRALLGAPAAEPARVAAADYAPRPGAAGYPQPARDLRPWLALMIGAVFLGERLLATGRRERAAP